MMGGGLFVCFVFSFRGTYAREGQRKAMGISACEQWENVFVTLLGIHF